MGALARFLKIFGFEAYLRSVVMASDLKQHSVKDVTVAEYVVQCLVDCGVTHVFGGHGGVCFIFQASLWHIRRVSEKLFLTQELLSR